MASDGSRSSSETRRSGTDAGAEGRPSDGVDIHTALRRADEAAEARRDRLRSRRFIPAEVELLSEIEEAVQDESPPKPLSQQVGVRLQPAQWKRLLLVAQWSGVRPTTMARILINRGARAIIDEELRHRRQFGPEADG